MKHLFIAVLFGFIFYTPMVWSQTSGFSQQGKVTHEMQDAGLNIAHSSLPLNSKVKMVNLSTGKEVEVTVTRQIPASAGRIADVSSSVWQALGMTPGSDARISTLVSTKPQQEDAPGLASQSGGAQSGGAGSQGGGSQFAGGAQGGGSQFAGGAQGEGSQFAGSQSGGAQIAGSQSTGSQIAGSSGTRTAQTGSGGSGGSGGTGSDFFGNMPGGVKFENNNNFTFYNGYPMAGTPPASAYTQPGQQGQGSPFYGTGSSATYSQPNQQGQGYGTGSAQPYVTYEPRQQPNQPVVIIDDWPMPAQPYVTYEPGQQGRASPLEEPGQRPDQFSYETLPFEPAVTNETRSAQGANDIWAQVAMPPDLLAIMSRNNKPVSGNETRTQPVQPVVANETLPSQTVVRIDNWMKTQSPLAANETPAGPVIPAEKKLTDIKPKTVNEILSPVSKTVVFIDAAPETPVPSVTVNNGQQSHKSVPDEE